MSGTPTSQLDGKKRKRSRWSDDPVSTASSGPVSTANSGPVSADAAAIAVAMASFSESPGPVGLRGGSLDTGGQQLTPAQLEQVKEQIEVSTSGVDPGILKGGGGVLCYYVYMMTALPPVRPESFLMLLHR